MGENSKPKTATSATSGTPVAHTRTPDEDAEDGALATTNLSDIAVILKDIQARLSSVGDGRGENINKDAISAPVATGGAKTEGEWRNSEGESEGESEGDRDSTCDLRTRCLNLLVPEFTETKTAKLVKTLNVRGAFD
jgi:hypothetical protein